MGLDQPAAGGGPPKQLDKRNAVATSAISANANRVRFNMNKSETSQESCKFQAASFVLVA